MIQKMKDSEISWIGDIPIHWKIIPFGRMFKERSESGYPDERNLSVYREYGVIPRDSRDDNRNELSSDLSNYKLVKKGDLVFNKMKCWQGSLGVSEYQGIVSPAYTICSPTMEIHGKYIHHLLRSSLYIGHFKMVSYGVRPGQWDLHDDDLFSTPIIIPPMEEQINISSMLDNKISVIDEIITIEEERVALFKEYKKSLLTEWVTGKIDIRDEVKK